MKEEQKINNNEIKLDNEILEILLIDNTTSKNIIWATNEYELLGKDYGFDKQILLNQITGTNNVIIPRIMKTLHKKQQRVKENAEVFTPSWICNKQNNLVDNKWFNSENVFNKEIGNAWEPTKNKIEFPEGKQWQEYVSLSRMEITCGEAPYLVSRYDAVTGCPIELNHRIGFLDRKLRIVSENVNDEDEWIKWAIIAMKNIYGYDWQGDNVLISRKNLLYTFIDYYKFKFNKMVNTDLLKEVSKIISWNIWQMDGIKCVVPNSCKNEIIIDYTLFGNIEKSAECMGCKKSDLKKHNGTYCKIMNWEKNKPVKFVSLIGMKKV